MCIGRHFGRNHARHRDRELLRRDGGGRLRRRRRGCCRIGSTARSRCIRPTAGWCRNSPRGTTSGGCCPWFARRWRRAASDRDSIDGIAYTAGPGLIGALLVGAGLRARAWPLPGTSRPWRCITWKGICWRRCSSPTRRRFHFSLCWCRAATPSWSMSRRSGRYRHPGRDTGRCGGGGVRQDGEDCWDCPIPGGAALAQLAESGRSGRFVFPRPMLDRPGLDFSFSGLKTAALVALRGRVLDDAVRADVARGFQEAVVETLAEKSPARAAGHRSSAPGRRRRRRRESAAARAAGARSRSKPGRNCIFRARNSAPTTVQ